MVGEEKQQRERDENKANTTARATMAHRPAKTRADAQNARAASGPIEQRVNLSFTFFVS